jgi:hypothetical protein
MSSALQDRLDELIGFFNRRVMDVPDGLFDRDARFALNGRSFESMLGRSDEDPLVRMIARGPAAYRFAAKPLLRALETALVSRVELTGDAEQARAVLALRGTLRGTGAVLDEVVSIDLALAPDGAIRYTNVSIPETALARIRAARQ